MPTYEFKCRNCRKVFELFISLSEYERRQKAGMRCKKCGSRRVVQQVGGFQVITSKKS